MHMVYAKHKGFLCLGLSPILKISHYMHANIPKSGKSKIRKILASCIFDKGYSPCNSYLPSFSQYSF
jgi:hypothetical protein